MGLRRLFLLSVTCALALAGCGDNVHQNPYGEAGVPGDGRHKDAGPGSDAIDAPRDAGPDAPPDALVCNSPQINCNGRCIDPTMDNMNCGGCAGQGGTDCAALSPAETCLSGICCPTGDVNSMGHCCASGDHWDNGICCASGQVNVGTAQAPLCCNPGQIDANGLCCATGQVNGGGNPAICCPSATPTNCGGTCVDTTSNNADCGLCGTMCTAGTQTCESSLCCANGDNVCQAACSNPNTDNNNCGGCNGAGGTMCSGSTPTCTGGICCATGSNNCGGTCSNPLTDNMNCGGCAGGGGGANCAASGQTCSNGICCPSGSSNSGGICCPTGTVNTGGICCVSGQINAGGICCAAGQVNGGGSPAICCNAATPTNCGGTCVNTTSNVADCGGCGNACATGNNCCSSACSNPTSDNNNCGACGTKCITGDSCVTDGTTDICCPNGQIDSSGHCCPSGDHWDTSGGNAGICCGANQYNSGGICCATGTTNCSGTCVNEATDVNHCGSCSNKCSALQVCSAGTCSSTCGSLTTCSSDNPPTCANLTNDNNNCGACNNGATSGSMICVGGQSCVSSACTCPSADPDFCSQQCIDPTSDPNNCGGCAGAGGVACNSGQTCQLSHCCDLGTSYCSGTGTCANLSSDPANCGSCGHACSSGQSCTNGACVCPFNTISCAGGCKVATNDPTNCGSCGNVCGSGANAGKPFCVSNSCVATCPPSTCSTGTGATARCVNPLDDNTLCGASGLGGACSGGTACTTGTGCSNGACDTEITVNPPPAKCVGAGPPIVLPPVGGGSCAGNLADVSFTFGLCTIQAIGPLSRLIQTDAFNSATGAYVGTWGAACATDGDCGVECSQSLTPCATNANCPKTGTCSNAPGTNCYLDTDCVSPGTCVKPNTCTKHPIPCIKVRGAAAGKTGTCAGGGLGTDVNEQDTADTDVGGAFWSYDTGGISTKGNVTVLERTEINGPMSYSHTAVLNGNSYIVGAFSASGSGTLSIGGGTQVAPDTGTLYEQTTACGSLPASLSLFGSPQCVQQAISFAKPCRFPSINGTVQPIPVKAIVQYFAQNNDDAALGISPNVLNQSNVRLDLPCGYYYFTSIQGGNVTIYVHGHVGVFVSGAIRSSQGVVFDLDPTATLDMFVANPISISQTTSLGNPSYPRFSRLYVGSNSCAGGAGACTVNEDCCSGVCTGNFCVGGGGNLTGSVGMSNSGNYNGLIWAGYGDVGHSNPLVMYGAIFSNTFNASGDTTIHYDNSIVGAPNECPPPTGQACDDCTNCNNQACVLGVCSSTCTADNQCCAPLHCDIGGTNQCIL